MKKIITIITLIGFSQLHAQVGISTETPMATLHVKEYANANDKPEGVMAPQLTKLQLANKLVGTFNTNQTGSIVYVTDNTSDVSGKPSETQVVDVNSIGYYYFDGTKWVKMLTGFAVRNANNGLSLSGETVQLGGLLIKPTTIDQNENTLAFTGSIVNSFSVDGNTLSVDAANNRIGIGNTAPTNTLDVNGDTRIRKVDTSIELNDENLVIDATGVVKRKLQDGIFRGGLKQQFETPCSNIIVSYDGNGTPQYFPSPNCTDASWAVKYKVSNFEKYDDPGNNMDATTGGFKAPKTGLYRISMSAAATFDFASTNASSANGFGQFVLGLVDQSDTWIVKGIFAIGTAQSYYGHPMTQNFTLMARLTKDTIYNFAVTNGVTLYIEDTGTSSVNTVNSGSPQTIDITAVGGGNMSLFEIEFVK